MKNIYFSFFLTITYLSLFAQSTIYNFNEISAFEAATMIMGNQATVSNANIQCPDIAGGLFTGASGLNDNLTEGIILTSGSAAIAFSANTVGSAGSNNGGPGYAALEDFPWAYSGTFNACVLEFDFVPHTNQISVAYIFGSEEYPEYVGSQFNDAMAILIEGEPEYPAHLLATDKNIALIPNSPAPGIHVAINLLNFASYGDFYMDNTGNQHIQYDGMTTLLPAVADVTPGNTYRLTFAIADAGDAIFDSGLFIAPFNREAATNRILNLHAFWDENSNNIKDTTEVALPNQSFVINPINTMIVSHLGGNANIVLPLGDYQASFMESSLWEMVEATNYDINVTGIESLNTYQFGLQPKTTVNSVVPYLISNPTRCNETITYWLTCLNMGTTVASGTVSLNYSDLLQYIEANPMPEQTVNGVLTWAFEDLYPGYHKRIKISFEMPDESFTGEIALTSAKVMQMSDGQFISENEVAYNSEVLCSYDPNDKLARSNLLGQSEFAYIADTIQYTVRFQNTGNDTAFNIRIEDTLDKKLDWTTFHPITASHDYRTELNRETGLATFYFNDILLPDSTTNEVESHGFVTFGIASLEGIEDKTKIENTASIFFDFNPPIITNTATLTLLQQVETGIEVLDNRYSIRVFPNPFSDFTTIEAEELPQGNYRLEVMDILGRKVRELKVDNGKMNLQRGDLESGLYLIRVLEENSNEVLGSGKVLVE
ncbi:MAG: choice-of-anchor L domain-containing protein [Chitinophagales bacterium]